MLDRLSYYLVYYEVVVFLYFIVLNSSYLLLTISSSITLFRYKHRWNICEAARENDFLMPNVAILSPAFNEETTIVNSVHSLLNVDYPSLEVVVVNDGSKDNTLAVLQENFKLVKSDFAAEPPLHTTPVRAVYRSITDDRLLVIDKENGGKADALNAGINHCRSRLFCAIDADCLVEKNALYKIVSRYLDRDAKVIALGGTIRIANGCQIENSEVVQARIPRRALPAFQVMEYIRSFLCGRVGWSQLRSLLIISGAFGLFEKKAVIGAGGYHAGSMGEDMELVVRLHRHMRKTKKKYKIIFVPDPVVWTQVPSSLNALAKQRNRWHQGLIESLLHNIKMCFNPAYGIVGMLGMPFFLLFDVIGPFV